MRCTAPGEAESLLPLIETLPRCKIGVEACTGAFYWQRRFEALGHDVKIIAPQYVKPFLKHQKNDRNDAEAICTALRQPNMRFVPKKTVEQQDIQTLHRARQRLVSHRTALVSQMRGILLDRGIALTFPPLDHSEGGKVTIRAAGLFTRKRPQIGYLRNSPLHLDSDAPVLVTAGAGAGKTRDFLAYIMCRSPGARTLTLDPRGELGALSIHVHAPYGDDAWFWNPKSLCRLPHHRCDPLDILKPASAYFHTDCQFVAESLIPLSGGGNGRYFELRAREWLGNLLKYRAERMGGTGLADLYRTVNTIDADAKGWADHLEAMLASRFESVHRPAGEMLAKQQDAPKEFGSIMGEIYGHLSFLDDPVAAGRARQTGLLAGGVVRSAPAGQGLPQHPGGMPDAVVAAGAAVLCRDHALQGARSRSSARPAHRR